MIQNIFQQISAPEVKISQRICTLLKDHQITMLQAMQILETGQIDISPGVTKIHTRLGIIGDRVGSGKTLTVLAACASLPAPTIPSRFTSSREDLVPIAIEHMPAQTVPHDVHSNLIVVPHYLEHQWIEEIQKHSTLKWIRLNRKIIGQMNSLIELDQYDIVLCKNTIYRGLYAGCEDKGQTVRFSRVFIDEADSISLPKLSQTTSPIETKYYWLITGTPENMIRMNYSNSFSNWGLRYLNPVQRLVYDIPWQTLDLFRYTHFVLLQNEPDFVEECLRLQDPIYHHYTTAPPLEVRILDGIIPPQSLVCLQSDDVDGALSYMDCVTNETNMIRSVTETLCNKRRYEMQRLQLAEENQLHERDKSLIFKRIELLDEKINSIYDRLQGCNECPICFTPFEEMGESYMVVDCCKNKVCIPCLGEMCQRPHLRCPFCREPITKNKVLAVKVGIDGEIRSTPKRPVTKSEMFHSILETIIHERDCRILVFSETPGTWTSVVSTILSLNIPFAIGQGSSDDVRKNVKKFQDGNVKVLLLNSTTMGAGLNLQCATDIVIYHTPSSQTLERQMIGRANRQGRTHPLHVHIMSYESEPSTCTRRIGST